MKLQAHETKLVGRWVKTEHGVVPDEVTERINGLTSNYLKHVAVDPTGWDHLYADPDDGRLWELSYPQSQWHGGGPPSLQVVTVEVAEQKYGRH